MANGTPNSQLGMNYPCPRCMAVPGMRCQSDSGRVLKVTHDPRARAEIHDDPVRRWVAQQREWVTG